MGLREEWADVLSLYGMMRDMAPHGAQLPDILRGDMRRGRVAGQILLSVVATQEGEQFVTSIAASPGLLTRHVAGLKQQLRRMIARFAHEGETAVRGTDMGQFDMDTAIFGCESFGQNEGLLKRVLSNHSLRVTQQSGGHWTGTVVMHTSLGDITLCATVSPEVIQALAAKVQVMHARMHGEEAAAGNIFGSIANLARKIARGRLMQRLASSMRAIARNPLIAKAVGIATSVIPGAAAIRTAVTTATSILGKLRRGDPAIRRQVGQIVAQARRGNPQARRAVRILQSVNQQWRQNPTAMAGFLYHRPMRPESEVWSLRDTYLRGMNLPAAPPAAARH